MSIFLCVLCILPLLAGCGMTTEMAEAGQTEPQKVTAAAEKEQPDKPQNEAQDDSYTVWNAYWNLEGAEAQIEEMAEDIRNVSYFAAYFNKDDKVFIPEETIAFYEKTGDAYRKRGWNCYLTIVNDQILADGSSSLKSTDLLYRLLAEEKTYQAHAEELIALTKQYGYDGLEIDYENIRKDETLWGCFMPFIEYLYRRCEEENLVLRVIIETEIKPEKINWVEGPVYVVMCYNLYGGHSGPGPKADKSFLEEVMKKMSYVPGKVDYALANGGFDWGADGKVSNITKNQAEQLLSENGRTLQRDDNSKAVHFTYTDKDGMSHEVWYADEETMQTWVSWISAGGNHQFSIWRLGE